MSEEAVRQTRSQKRALERDPTQQSMEPSNSDNESKKPKLDPSEHETQVQNSSAASAAVAEDDGQNQTRDVLKQEEQSRSPLPSALPLAPQQAKNNRESQDGMEPGSDTRTDSNDRANRVKTEQPVDMKSRARVTEPKTADGMLAAGEVKATIKVEVQTAEQPVDMSTSRGWATPSSQRSRVNLQASPHMALNVKSMLRCVWWEHFNSQSITFNFNCMLATFMLFAEFELFHDEGEYPFRISWRFLPFVLFMGF